MATAVADELAKRAHRPRFRPLPAPPHPPPLRPLQRARAGIKCPSRDHQIVSARPRRSSSSGLIFISSLKLLSICLAAGGSCCSAAAPPPPPPTFTPAPMQQQELAPVTSGASVHALRVAAFASKLEQWFACQRQQAAVAVAAAAAAAAAQQSNNGPTNASSSSLTTPNPLSISSNSLAPPTQQMSSQQGPSATTSDTINPLFGAADHCQAHFDGHLCWPATYKGSRAALACPQVAHLDHSHRLQRAAGAGAGAAHRKRQAVQMGPARPLSTTASGTEAALNSTMAATTTTTTTMSKANDDDGDERRHQTTELRGKCVRFIC